MHISVLKTWYFSSSTHALFSLIVRIYYFYCTILFHTFLQYLVQNSLLTDFSGILPHLQACSKYIKCNFQVVEECVVCKDSHLDNRKLLLGGTQKGMH